MENLTFWLVVVLATIAVYRLLSRRVMTPKARVTGMLRRYRALERTGLSEQECLLQLLAIRRDWKRLPHRFLAELVSRLRSQEDVMRFVSVSEDYGYHRDHYPEIATRIDLEMAMAEVACLFARFGFQLQTEGRYREAEFVQKLALCLQPNQYFTTLPLAATYHETGRHDDALPLFRQGLDRFQDFENNTNAVASALSPAKCLAPDVEIRNLRNRYRKMYEACVKATEGKSLSRFYVLISMELLF
jgi:tetratricopeptide (TPR) repeat protein